MTQVDQKTKNINKKSEEERQQEKQSIPSNILSKNEQNKNKAEIDMKKNNNKRKNYEAKDTKIFNEIFCICVFVRKCMRN